MNGYAIAIVVDDPEYRCEYFDHIILMDQDTPAGVVQKIRIGDYTLFAETLFIDSDCLCFRPFGDELAKIRDLPFAALSAGYLYPGQESPYLENLDRTLSDLGIGRLPHFNAVFILGTRVFLRTRKKRSH